MNSMTPEVRRLSISMAVLLWQLVCCGFWIVYVADPKKVSTANFFKASVLLFGTFGLGIVAILTLLC